MRPIIDKANKVYLVVGCHGSATSLITKGLERCGISIGNYVIRDVLDSLERGLSIEKHIVERVEKTKNDTAWDYWK